MSSDQTQNFKGIVSCIPSFGDASCLTYLFSHLVRPSSSVSAVFSLSPQSPFFFSIYDFSASRIKFTLILLCFSWLGFSSVFLSLFLANMIYCFWNNLYPFYSIETYCHNLYFLSIVVYTTKSYLLKQGPKQKVALSRVSDMSNDSSEEQSEGVLSLIRTKILTNIKFYKFLYKTMTIVFLLLFTLIFITSLIGDIKSKQQG